jgi:tetratricopeptide (TPR) repeat protein
MISKKIAEQMEIADKAYKKYDYASALSSYKKALALLSKELDSPHKEKAYGDLFLRIIDVLDFDGKWVDAVMYVETIMNIARSRDDIHLEIEANLRACGILTKRGNWKQVIVRYLKILELTKKHRSVPATAECHYGLAYVYWRLGDMDKAKINAEKTLDIIKEDEQFHMLKGKSLILLATIADNIGKSQLSIDKFKDAIKFLENIDDQQRDIELARAYNNLGEAYKGQEDYHTATEQYEKCVAVAKRSNDKQTEAYGLINAGECLAKEGQVAEADAHIERAEEILETIDDQYASAYTHYARGLIACKKRKQGDATKEYETTIDALEKLEAPYDIGIVCFEYAKALQTFGEKENARKMYKKAMINLRKVDASFYLKKAETALKKLKG